jgi:hypothetical protein
MIKQQMSKQAGRVAMNATGSVLCVCAGQSREKAPQPPTHTPGALRVLLTEDHTLSSVKGVVFCEEEVCGWGVGGWCVVVVEKRGWGGWVVGVARPGSGVWVGLRGGVWAGARFASLGSARPECGTRVVDQVRNDEARSACGLALIEKGDRMTVTMDLGVSEAYRHEAEVDCKLPLFDRDENALVSVTCACGEVFETEMPEAMFDASEEGDVAADKLVYGAWQQHVWAEIRKAGQFEAAQSISLASSEDDGTKEATR